MCFLNQCLCLQGASGTPGAMGAPGALVRIAPIENITRVSLRIKSFTQILRMSSVSGATRHAGRKRQSRTNGSSGKKVI